MNIFLLFIYYDLYDYLMGYDFSFLVRMKRTRVFDF